LKKNKLEKILIEYETDLQGINSKNNANKKNNANNDNKTNNILKKKKDIAKLKRLITKYSETNKTDNNFIFELIINNAIPPMAMSYTKGILFKLSNINDTTDKTSYINQEQYPNLFDILNKIVAEDLGLFKQNTAYNSTYNPYIVYLDNNKYTKTLFQELNLEGHELKQKIENYSSKSPEEQLQLLNELSTFIYQS
jgi:hypothetical protein